MTVFVFVSPIICSYRIMKLAILGGGSVGGGVVELLGEHPDIHIEYLLVRDVARARDFKIPKSVRVVDDWEIIAADVSVDLVVELMGGTTLAWEIVKSCLTKGVSVVTANKAMISKYMPEIEALLDSYKSRKPAFMYEAAVCGGIPIINTLIRGMACDEIESIYGVMNGSTNWMLERMDEDGIPFDDLMIEAKGLGYLEADPSADICGWDARSKLCILARLAFGVRLDENQVACVGIDRVSLKDVAYANQHGRKLRLIAKAWKDRQSGRVHACVMPSMVPVASTAGNLPGATNCVCFQAKYSGSNAMVGSGAGRYPTANSVVADILEIHRERSRAPEGAFSHHFGSVGVSEKIRFEKDFVSRFYVRGGDETKIKNAGIPYQRCGDVLETEMCSFEKLASVLHRDCTVIAIL